LKNYPPGIWACDFLPVIDLFFRTIYIFFIFELGSRRVVHFGVTRHPTDDWVAPQLREATPFGQTQRYLIHENDSKFGGDFCPVAKSSGIEVLRVPYRAPRANAACERFLKSVRHECLDHMLMLSEPQLYQVVKEYFNFFNACRPHLDGQMIDSLCMFYSIGF
jgi:putative transposase